MHRLLKNLKQSFSSVRNKSTLAAPANFKQNIYPIELGEIPEPLKYDHQYQETKLSNGIRVATEHYDAPLSTVGIMIDAGSRNETMANTGTAHFLEHLHFKGTNRRTRVMLERGIENMGGNLNAYTSRETTLYQMQVFKQDVGEAVDIMADMILNSKYDPTNVEIEKEVILREADEVDADTREMILENIHFTSYRDHIMGQPILGNRDSIRKITNEDLKKFVYTHYIGPRLVVVGGGPVEHNRLVEISESILGNLRTSTEIPIVGEDKPTFTGSTIHSRDDCIDQVHLGLFYPAPSWADPDYWAFLLLQRIIAETDPEQSNILSVPNLLLGNQKIASQEECLYIPYKDVGMIGYYASVAEDKVQDLTKQYLEVFEKVTQEVPEEELVKGKNKIFHELLQLEVGAEVIQTLGSQLIYMNRRVPKSEIAKRVAALDSNYLKSVFQRWFKGQTPSLAFHGKLDQVEKMYHVYNF